ncbi:uncharacterized protein LOC129752374 [Uranotaenia lowii]|uniref:uncharacterized protein LOC129752374 n=1 Tax=Uranotaenia lowii TaxID=190385 RepID=UPI0024786678|nr:uncharacterized protein LOC129752374 [Uranotaenia lowii]
MLENARQLLKVGESKRRIAESLFPKQQVEPKRCETPDPLPSTSGRVKSIDYEEPLNLSKRSYVTPAEIRPLPKRKDPQQRRKKGQKSEIITSTPVKPKLESNLQQKKAKPPAKRKFATETDTAKGTNTTMKEKPPKGSEAPKGAKRPRKVKSA